MSTFFINSKPNFINSPRGLEKDPLDSMFLDSRVLDNFTLTNQLSTEALQRLNTCLSVIDEKCGKLVSLRPIIFGDNIKVTSV